MHELWSDEPLEDKAKTSGKKVDGPVCWKCGGKGHVGKDCPSKPRNMNSLDEAGSWNKQPKGDLDSLYIGSLVLDLNPLDTGSLLTGNPQVLPIGIDSGAAR